MLLPGTAVGRGAAGADAAAAQPDRRRCSCTTGSEVFVTFSAGVTAWRPGEPLETALERADEALYEAKRTGKNRTCVGLKPAGSARLLRQQRRSARVRTRWPRSARRGHAGLRLQPRAGPQDQGTRRWRPLPIHGRPATAAASQGRNPARPSRPRRARSPCAAGPLARTDYECATEASRTSSWSSCSSGGGAQGPEGLHRLRGQRWRRQGWARSRRSHGVCQPDLRIVALDGAQRARATSWTRSATSALPSARS